MKAVTMGAEREGKSSMSKLLSTVRERPSRRRWEMELMQKNQHIRSRGKWGASEMPANVCRRQQGSNNRLYRITSLSIDNLVIHGVYLCSMRLSPPDDYTPDYC